MKLNELIKCPHCGKESCYVFYDNAETLKCNHCDKPFDISLKTIVDIVATVPKRRCWICNIEFIATSDFEEDNICPNCGCKGGHYQI